MEPDIAQQVGPTFIYLVRSYHYTGTANDNFVAGPAKYGGSKGHFHHGHPALDDVAPALQCQLIQVLNQSLADSTWEGIRYVENSVRKMADKFQLDLTFPWGRGKVINYILSLTMEAG